MDFAPAKRRDLPESIVPMINVVYLLLIFFLMTAQIAPPDPVEVMPPVSQSTAEVPQDGVLYLGADGTLAFAEGRGEEALEAAVSGGAVVLKADAGVAAVEVARLLPRLAALGAKDIRLVTAEGAKP